jgi:Ca2+-binding EF-hand superfamily protein
VETPEEHRERYRVARDVLGTFRHNLRIRSGSGSDQVPLSPGVPELMRRRIRVLFAQLDRDGDGSLNLAELRDALKSASPTNGAGLDPPSAGPQLAAALAAMDLDGDGRVDLAEFTELIHRLQLLREGEERLLLYLMPADADGDDQLDADELQQLLLSIGQQPLSAAEQGLVFGPHASALTWRGFVDRLLLT